MQNRPSDYTINYLPHDLPSEFPVSNLFEKRYSPPSNDVSNMHFHNCMELGYCYEGCGVFFVNDKIMPFSAGDASIIFPNDIHIARSDTNKPSQWHFIMINPVNLLEGVALDQIGLVIQANQGSRAFQNVIDKNHVSKIPELILDIITELEGKENHFRQVIKSMTWSLTLKLCRLLGQHSTEINETSDHSVISRIFPALNHINEHYADPISIKFLAKLSSLSVTHFRRLFMLSMGVAPSVYIYAVRIKTASNMVLNSDLSITDIAMKVGYESITSFNRHFKRVMEATPREWRKKHIPH
jgi:AraC family transcriptional regulator, activator of mtrCDE